MGRLLAAARRWSRQIEIAITLLAAVLAVVWVDRDGYKQDLVILTCTYAFVALGIYVPFIMNGSLSLAYNAYLGLGAYSVALAATRWHMPVLLAILLGMLAAAASAIMLGYATRKLTGFYLAAVTLLFGEAYGAFLIDVPNLTGGAAGIGGVPFPSIFGYTLTRTSIVVIAIACVWLTATLLSSLRRSPYGVAVRAQKEVVVAVEASGVRTSVVAIAALALGAAIAAFGGSIFTIANHSIFPESLTLDIVFLAVFTPLLGGQRSPWGSIIGAVLITYFTFGLSQLGEYLGLPNIQQAGTLVFALAVLAVLLLAPNGILGLLSSGLRLVTWRAQDR